MQIMEGVEIKVILLSLTTCSNNDNYHGMRVLHIAGERLDTTLHMKS